MHWAHRTGRQARDVRGLSIALERTFCSLAKVHPELAVLVVTWMKIRGVSCCKPLPITNKGDPISLEFAYPANRFFTF